MIEFINVSKTYPNNVAALDRVSLRIDGGEFVFIVGESGSGKSTLIKLILREEIATGGRITVNGENVTDMPKNHVPYLRRKIGVVFQDFRLLPNKTAYENVAFAMQITGASYREIRRNVPYALSMVGLTRKSRMYPGQLSGGEQQRVALARAIVNRPSTLLADEPTGNLDPDNAWEIMTLLSDVNASGTTVIAATHAREMVNSLNRRVVRLNKGVVLSDDEEGHYDIIDDLDDRR